MFGIDLSKWTRDNIIALRDECNRFLSTKTYGDTKCTFADKCTCHERDSSYACEYCYSLGLRGHMDGDESSQDN